MAKWKLMRAGWWITKSGPYEMMDLCKSRRRKVHAEVQPIEGESETVALPIAPSELERVTHELAHIPFQSWHTSCVKDKAQLLPHRRIKRVAEDSELPIVQCEYLIKKDIAATDGLKFLSMYVKSFGYGMSTGVESKGAGVAFAEMWAVKMLNSIGLSNIIMQCDPEPSLIKRAEGVDAKRQERTDIRSSPRRSHQGNGANENNQKQLRGQVLTMAVNSHDGTQYRPIVDSARMRCIIRHAAWLILRFRPSPKFLEFGEIVLAHLSEVWKGFRKSNSEAGTHMEIWGGARKERPRAPCQNWSRNRVRTERATNQWANDDPRRDSEKSSTHHSNPNRRWRM